MCRCVRSCSKHSVSTGDGRSRRHGYFQAQPQAAAANHLTDKAVWYVCDDAAQHAGPQKTR